MPLYDYRCPECGVFEMAAGREEREVECACGRQASRLPFSGIPAIKGDTVARDMPPRERFEADKKAFERSWGTEERALEMMRGAVREDREGRKFVDTPSLMRG